MMAQSSGKLAIVTGASTGIGYFLAHECAMHGYDLVVAADEARIEEAAAELRRTGVAVRAVEVDLATGKITVKRMVVAIDAGPISNPDGLRNQVIGANIMGLGGGLFESIEFENGKISNPHLAQYRVPRFRDIPLIEAVLLDRKDIPPAGAGETPIVGLAPAIGNAIFDATGIRLRHLPMVPRGLNNLKISA